jgi:nucleoside-diphosphate-sugar epimerase
VKVLVTGAAGFLGRHVVAELIHRGHRPRALLRPASDVRRLGWNGDVEVVRGDLRDPATLTGVADGAEAVLHLATPVSGDAEEAFTTAVTGTEHLIAALAPSAVQHIVLASSVTVYDWSALRGTVTEDSPLVDDPWPRGAYTVAKLWQERVAQRDAAALGRALTILRPGFIWGPGNPLPAGIGPSVGSLHLVVSGRHRLPATHVENCAHCFVTALEHERARGKIYNVVDGRGISPWHFMSAYLQATGRGRRVALPYGAVRASALVARATARCLFEHGGRLPSVLDPPRSEARFKPLQWTSERLESELCWRPPLTFEQAVSRTYRRD